MKKKLIESHSNGIKECSSCKIYLHIDNFRVRIQGGKPYIVARCRKCENEINLSKSTPEKRREQSRAYRERNKNNVEYKKRNCEQAKKYRSKNLEKCRARERELSKLRWRKDSEYRNKKYKRTQKWIKDNKEKFRKWRRGYDKSRWKLIPEHRLKSKEFNKNWRNNNRAYVRSYERKFNKENNKKLPDHYIRNVLGITKQNPVPSDLIKLKRLQLKAKQILKIKQHESYRTTQPNV